MTRTCGDETIDAGRHGTPGVYAFFANHVLGANESCLDVGGGLGIGFDILRRKSLQVRSIDLDPRLAQMDVERGDVRHEADGAYDWVVAVDVVEHVEEDEEFIQNLWRVARKGVFVSSPNLDHHPDRIWPFHVREYTALHFKTLCQKGCPGAKIHHFGSEVYGGHLTYCHLGAQWEHQEILALKQPNYLLGLTLYLRDVAMKILR